jgi:DNA gyrase subunit A
VLYFSSRGQVYKEKVGRLPVGAPHARGKARINMLPLEQGERITTIMPLPEDEDTWDRYDVMFATSNGNVRRNKLSDFVNVNRAGKIAMKLDEGDAIVDVQVCSVDDDVLLTTANGQCIRFAVPDVRVFKGRDSTGVRGITLAKGDTVISLAILRHVDATAEERQTYLRRASAMRRARGEELGAEELPTNGDATNGDVEEEAADVDLGDRYAEMDAKEQFVLTLTVNGYGKRSSAYEYRVTNRGGKGITAMVTNSRNGKLVSSFPVESHDQVMLITDRGQTIRVPVDGIRIAGRSTQGVIVFDTAEDEHVVSVEHISGGAESEVVEGGENGGSEPSAPGAPPETPPEA